MADSLGADLVVVPNFVAHDASQMDLMTHRRALKGPIALQSTEVVDLDVFSGRQNLAQALILRLLTPIGSLAALGHAAYGSRLHQLIGQRKTNELRNLCRAFVLEVVAQEPRVEDKAVSLNFDPLAETSDTFVFTLATKPRDGGEPVGLTLAFAI